MGEMRDSDWSRPNLLRSDWLPTIVAMCTTTNVKGKLSTAKVSENELEGGVVRSMKQTE